jgi:hypothetical protein
MESIIDVLSKLSIEKAEDKGETLEKLAEYMMDTLSGQEGLQRFQSTQGWNYINNILQQETLKIDYTQIDETSVLVIAVIGETCLQSSSPELLEAYLEDFMNWMVFLSMICRQSHSILKFRLMQILKCTLELELPSSFHHALEMHEMWKKNICDAVYDVLRSKVTPQQILPSIMLINRMLLLYHENLLFKTEEDVKLLMLLLQRCSIEIYLALDIDWCVKMGLVHDAIPKTDKMGPNDFNMLHHYRNIDGGCSSYGY